MSAWPNLSDLLLDDEADTPIALVGAPLAAGSVTPGACDQAPVLLRQTLKRIGRYDIDIGRELVTPIRDRGDVALAGLTIEQATDPIREAVAASIAAHPLTLVVGGNNAVTRPAVLALGVALDKVGLITLDAHFDMRDLDNGLSNGNPVRALMDDGLPGRNIAQIGLASFANTAKMHRDALAAARIPSRWTGRSIMLRIARRWRSTATSTSSTGRRCPERPARALEVCLPSISSGRFGRLPATERCESSTSPNGTRRST